MYHIVYLTTNLINNKMYVGVHSTYNLNDGYFGSGYTLKPAIKKYGIVNFKRQILHYCLEASHAYELEAQIVDENFIQRKDTYNITIGGYGGSRKGRVLSEKTKQKMSISRIGKSYITENGRNKLKILHLGSVHSNETKFKLRKPKIITNEDKEIRSNRMKQYLTNMTKEERMTRRNNSKGNAKQYKFISPTGEEFIIFGGFKNFCNEHNLSKSVLYKHMNGKVTTIPKYNHSIKSLNTIGWSVFII